MSEYPLPLRQMMVLGEAAQRRLAAVTAEVAGTGLAHEVAARYALGAGVAGLAPGPIAPSAPEWLASAPARAVLEGARAALALVRDASEGDG